jgi:hypothetical protein
MGFYQSGKHPFRGVLERVTRASPAEAPQCHQYTGDAGVTSVVSSLQQAGEYAIGRRTAIQAASANDLQQLSIAQSSYRSNHSSPIDPAPTSNVIDSSRCSTVSRVAKEYEPNTNFARLEFGHAMINERIEGFKTLSSNAPRCLPSCGWHRVGAHDRPFFLVVGLVVFDDSCGLSNNSWLADSEAGSIDSMGVNRWCFLSKIKSMSLVSP